MTNIVTHNYQGFAITQKERDSYVSLTDMAKAAGKLVGHYLTLDSTNEYLQALSDDIAIPISSLIQVVQGKGKHQGTWAHPEIAIDFASWCNVQFRIWANRTLHRGIAEGYDRTVPLDSDLKAKLKSVNNKILAFKLAKAEKVLAKLEAESQSERFVPDMMESIAEFCKGKSRVSVTEALYFIEPQKKYHTAKKCHDVIICLHKLGYKKTGCRYRTKINSNNVQAYSWEAIG